MLVLAGPAFAQQTQPSSDSGDPGLAIFCLAMQCIIPLISLAVWVMVAKWVKNDAEAYGIDNPMLWAVLVFQMWYEEWMKN